LICLDFIIYNKQNVEKINQFNNNNSNNNTTTTTNSTGSLRIAFENFLFSLELMKLDQLAK
jgi:hypothetical protein